MLLPCIQQRQRCATSTSRCVVPAGLQRLFISQVMNAEDVSVAHTNVEDIRAAYAEGVETEVNGNVADL